MILSAKKRNTSTPWLPTDAATAPSWWLKDTGIGDVGGVAETWTNEMSADQLSDTTSSPTVSSDEGHDIVVFDESGPMNAADLLGGSVSDVDIFLLIRWTTSKNFLISLNGTTTGSPGRIVATAPFSGLCYWDMGAPSGTNRISATFTDTGFNAGEWGILNLRGGTNIQEIYMNGTLQASDVTGHTVDTTGGLKIGHTGTTLSTVDIAQILIYKSRLSDSDREKVEGYLAHYMGAQAELPVAHPYTSSPPTV